MNDLNQTNNNSNQMEGRYKLEKRYNPQVKIAANTENLPRLAKSLSNPFKMISVEEVNYFIQFEKSVQ